MTLEAEVLALRAEVRLLRERSRDASAGSGRPKQPTLIAASSLPVDTPFRGISVAGLAALIDPANPANELKKVKCGRVRLKEDGIHSYNCQAELEIPAYFVGMMACEDCIKAFVEADLLERARTYWESICPAGLRDTSLRHADFPKAQYEQTKGYCGASSLFLVGPSRSGKTRLATLLLKRCLVHHNKHVGAMWPEDLKDAGSNRARSETVKRWGKYDVLLMDDALLTGAADGRTADILKDIVDYRQRHGRHNIITSQIGKMEYKEEAGKYSGGKLGKATDALLEALFNRLAETCTQITFYRAKPAGAGSQDF